MNSFYTHIQPNIIKFSDEDKIPEHLRCHYAINYNVWGIDYFFENYLLQESTDGIFMILNEDSFNFVLEDSLSQQEVIDIPRLYIVISEKFLGDDSKFQEFIIKGAKDNEIYANGIEGFMPGVDYYLNQTLFNYLTNINAIQNNTNNSISPTDIQLPNYLDSDGDITKYFIDLSSEIIKDYTNLDYYYKKNFLLDGNYSEDELNNFYKFFCGIILKDSTIKSNNEIYIKQKNQIYEKVLKYYANSKVDDTSITLNLILNSNYNTVSTQQYSIQNCGCNNGNNDLSITQSCSSLYEQAMPLYLKQMFGDKEFYEDWFCVFLSDDEKIPNDLLIERLNIFIREFMDIDYNLDLNSNKTSYQCDCQNQLSLNNSSLEYKKLTNFLQILGWVYENKIDENSNKIKIYGEQFGELLPNLEF